MAYKSLRAFINALERRGELVRVAAPVSPKLEITEIADRVSKAGGPALLFENVEGSRYPVLINAMGSYSRMALALGAQSTDDIGADLARYVDLANYTSFKRLLRFLPRLPRLLCCFPLREYGRPPCREVVDSVVNLSSLPVLQCWPQDGGRFFTLPLVFTHMPGEKTQNVGMYRMQVLDDTSTAMHWHKHKDGSAIYEAWRARGGKMPVAVALGCDPAVTYAATAPLPAGVDEMMLAGFLRRRPVRMAKCLQSDLRVPADAEFVLEGYVDTDEEPVWEGPFGDHTGYYSIADWYPRFHVTCVTHRKEAVYPATVVGKPPMEDCYLAKATERIFLPLLRLQMPQLAELNLPLAGVFHNCAIAAVKNSFPGAARTVMNAMWGMGQMRYTKMIVAVEEGVNPGDYDAVFAAVLRHADFERDLVRSVGPLDALDHSSAHALYGTRLGVDATVKPWGDPAVQGGLLVLNVEKHAAGDGLHAAEQALLKHPRAKLIFVVDQDVNPSDRATAMWRVFNNIDASRDLVLRHGRLAVDATRKLQAEGLTRPWPQDIVMSPDMAARVTARWEEYRI